MAVCSVGGKKYIVCGELSWADESLWYRFKVTLHCGRNSPFEFWSQGACCRVRWGGVEWLCTGVHGTVPLARESCLSGSGQPVHAWGYPGLAMVQSHARACVQTLLDHKTCCRWFCFVIVWCIMQIIVTKYSITVLTSRLQSCTLIVEQSIYSGDGWLLEQAG